MIWKDITSYSRDQKDKTPNTWETRAGGVRIVICNRHIHEPGVWLFSYYGVVNHTIRVGFDWAPQNDLERAQADAVHRLRTVLTKVLEGLA